MSESLFVWQKADLQNRNKPGFENALRGLLATQGRAGKIAEVLSLLSSEIAALPAGEEAAWMLRYGKVLHSGTVRPLDSTPEEDALADFGRTMIALGKDRGSREALSAALEEFRQKHAAESGESVSV